VPEPPTAVVKDSIDGLPPGHVQEPGGHGIVVVVVVPGAGQVPVVGRGRQKRFTRSLSGGAPLA